MPHGDVRTAGVPRLARYALPGGARFEVRPDSVDPHVLLKQYRQPRFFARDYVPAAGDTVLDVGAHIGVFTVLAARLVPRGRVHALEAEAENLTLLRRNVALNGLANVEVHGVALSGASGPVELHHATETWGHSIRAPADAARGGRRTVVQGRSLEDFLADHRLERVDYMKMNVEGAEYDILAAAPTDVLAAVGHMLVEFHPVPGQRGEDLGAQLRSCGFEVHVERDGESGKGWLTARRRDAGSAGGSGQR